MNPATSESPLFSCTPLYLVRSHLQGHLLQSRAIVVCESPFFSFAPDKRSGAYLWPNHLHFNCFCFSVAFLYTWSTCRAEFISLTLQYTSCKSACATDVSHDQTAGWCCEQMGSTIANLWHWKKNWLQSFYLDSSVGGMRGVSVYL